MTAEPLQAALTSADDRLRLDFGCGPHTGSAAYARALDQRSVGPYPRLARTSTEHSGYRRFTL